MKIVKKHGAFFDPYSMVKVTKMGSIIECMTQKSKPTEMPFDRLDKDTYALKSTGEVKEFVHNEKRVDDLNGIRSTLKQMRNIINNNFFGLDHERHMVLTYAENMTDTKRLYKDFERFWKKFQYAYGKQAQYFLVVEPQGRGAWHVHVLVRFLEPNTFIANNTVLAPMWGHGFTKIKSLKGVDNIGAYLSAYLGDLELLEGDYLEQGLEVKIKVVDGEKKAFIKGARLHLYPANMNIYRHSRGISPPKVENVTYEEYKKIVGKATPNYSTTITISDDYQNTLNVIQYEHYNLSLIHISEPTRPY